MLFLALSYTIRLFRRCRFGGGGGRLKRGKEEEEEDPHTTRKSYGNALLILEERGERSQNLSTPSSPIFFLKKKMRHIF